MLPLVKLLKPNDCLNWCKSRSITPFGKSNIFVYEYFNFKILTNKKRDDKVPILIVTNSNLVPRNVCICLRSFEEFNQMASVLRYYVRMNELPSVPSMKRNEKMNGIRDFMKWCGSCKEIITLSAVQLFLYTIEPMENVVLYFQNTRQNTTTITWGHKPRIRRPVLSKSRQSYEQEYLLSELSTREMFEYSSLATDVEMGMEALYFNHEQDDTFEYNRFEMPICSDLLVIHPEDLEK